MVTRSRLDLLCLGGMTRVYFVTNRNPKPKADPKDFGTTFSDAGVDDLRFGAAEVTKPKGKWRFKLKTAAEKLNPDDHSKSPVLGSQAVFKKLQAQMLASEKDSLIFLHGYGVSFKDALVTAARLAAANAEHIGQTAVFTWPSDGRLIPFLSYKSDRTDARSSGPAFARAFIKTSLFIDKLFREHKTHKENRPCGGRLHLFAHSMGNYVLRNAFQEVLRQQSGVVRRLFENIFMLAADEDYDCFDKAHKLESLPLIANNIHVYFNRGDAALRISDGTKANPNRLGTDGPHYPLNVPGNVTNVDVSGVVGGPVEHHYYVDDARVMADIRQVLGGEVADKVPGRRYVASQNKYVLQ